MSSLFSNVSARMRNLRAAQREEKDVEDKPVDHAESYRIRARMVGLLLLDARLKAERSREQCAHMLRVDAEQIERWETGDETPSLPQLEVLSFFLDVPISHFWGVETLTGTQQNAISAREEYLALRDRMIGALIRSAREERTLSLDGLSAETGIPSWRLEQYELGEVPIPMHELTVVSNVLRKSMAFFLESHSHLGELLAMREEWKHFTQLPDDVRQFAANPLNIGFIEIAIMFSQMPAERLRKIGESVLNIAP